MSELSFKFINLTFISSKQEIRRQIRNTIIFSYLYKRYNDVREFSEILESTQYGLNAAASEIGANKFLRISDIKEGVVDWESVPLCECNDEKTYKLYKDDILVARTGGTTGKSFLITDVPENAVFAGYLIRLRTKEHINPSLIYEFLNSYAYWSQISEMKMGSAQPNVNAQKLKKLKIPFAPNNVLVEVANLLSGEKYNLPELTQLLELGSSGFESSHELEVLFNLQENLIDKLRQEILQEAVQGKLTEHWRKENPKLIEGKNSASALLENIKAEKEQLIKEGKIKKEKPLPAITENEIPYELPDSWVWCRLQEIGLVNPKNNITDDLDVSFVPMKLVSQEFGINPEYEIKKWQEIKKGFTHFANDDVVLAKITPCFQNSKAGIMKGLENNYGAGSTELLVYRSFWKFLLPEYVYLFFKSPRFLNNGVEKMTGTAGQQRVPKDYVFQSPFPFAAKEEQKAIVGKVNNLMALCDCLEKEVKESKVQVEQLMKSVLREVFEG